MKIHVTIPTNNFNVFYNKFYQGISAFRNFKSTFTFGINFQNYTREQINIILSEFKRYDLEVYYTIKSYNFPVYAPEMQVIRNDCAILNPKADYYLICDDDLKYYDNDTFYKTMQLLIQYLNDNPSCKVVSIQRGIKLNKPVISSPIRLTEKLQLETYFGLCLKNIYHDGQIVEDEYLHCVGGYNDLIMAYSRLTTKDDLGVLLFSQCGEHVGAKPYSEICFQKYGWHKCDDAPNSNKNALIKIFKTRIEAAKE